MNETVNQNVHTHLSDMDAAPSWPTVVAVLNVADEDHITPVSAVEAGGGSSS